MYLAIHLIFYFLHVPLLVFTCEDLSLLADLMLSNACGNWIKQTFQSVGLIHFQVDFFIGFLS